MNEDFGYVILFCGLPGTLKTFISTRLASRLGFCYIPTRAIGEIPPFEKVALLNKKRYERYQKIGHILKAATQLKANIIVDGGFPTYESRKIALQGYDPFKTIIVHCYCFNEIQRIERLRIKAKEPLNYEAESAKAIIDNLHENAQIQTVELLDSDLNNTLISGYIDVDTVNYQIKRKGTIPKFLSKKLLVFIKDALDEYTNLPSSKTFQDTLSEHFDQLAEDYDASTVWRTDSTLLQSIQQELPDKPARVLDIGTGTGIAGEWYAKQGNLVTGIDISPLMLKKASKRLSLVVLGSILKSPFLSEYFDLAIIRQTLHYLEIERSFFEINRVIKPGGLLVLSCLVVPDETTKTLWAEFKNVTQPLRLRVFTVNDIEDVMTRFHFTILRKSHHEIVRQEKVSDLDKRATSPTGGWVQFLRNFEKLINQISPQIKFSFEKDSLSYKQFWVTIWGKKQITS